jgi:CDP-diacylglycerol---glycerol-3-phosphate 3-phosphatidyltransferase
MVTFFREDKTVLNLANALTVLRMLLAPFFMFAVLNSRFIEAFIIIIVATFSDFLDGQIARIWKMQTRFGRMLDPLADKIIISFGVIALLIKFQFPLWIAIIILSRDIFLLIGSCIFLFKNRQKFLVPNLLGKLTTFFQMATIVAFIINKIKPFSWPIIIYLLIFTVIFTIASAVVYTIKGYRLFFKAKTRKPSLNLPNKITLARILLIPIFIGFLLSNIPYRTIVATSIFIILALSDALDGYIARKKNQMTSLGALIDPLADKLLISSALIFLIGKGVDAWIAYTIIAREFIITGLRMIAVTRNYVLPAKFSGKIKTVVQVIAIVFVLMELPYADWIILIAAIVTVYSGIEYIWTERKLIKALM